jgi:hypothetical protein
MAFFMALLPLTTQEAYAAKAAGQCLLRVSLDKTHIKHNTSAVALIADMRHQLYGVAQCLQLARPGCAEAQASMPTRHGGSFWKNANTYRRFNCRRTTVCPSAPTL